MVQDNLNQSPLTDPATNRLIQQLFGQIQALDGILNTLIDVSAIGHTDSPSDETFVVSKTFLQEFGTAQQVLQTALEERQTELHESLRLLEQRIRQIELLYTISNQHGDTVGVDRVLQTAIDALWQKIPLRFAVVILGETELGPYTYQIMRGLPDTWQYQHKPCPFPLWGVLARALLPRLNPEEPDYLIIHDIETEQLPLAEEFPWMEHNGSLMILPLRADKRAQGAFLIGSSQTHVFADENLCLDYTTIANHTARTLQLAQMRQELNERSGQLLSLQLFTKSIASVQNYDKLVDVVIEGIFEAMGRVNIFIILGNQVWQRGNDKGQTLPTQIRRIIDWSMQAGQPIFYDLDDAEGSIDRFYYNDSGHALVVPILRNERTHGAIQVFTSSDGPRFEEGDLIVLRTIANCVAIMLPDVNHS